MRGREGRRGGGGQRGICPSSESVVGDGDMRGERQRLIWDMGGERQGQMVPTLSTPGMYSLGTVPPLISLLNTKPEPGSPGSKRIATSANWPDPPDCFLCTYRTWERQEWGKR